MLRLSGTAGRYERKREPRQAAARRGFSQKLIQHHRKTIFRPFKKLSEYWWGNFRHFCLENQVFWIRIKAGTIIFRLPLSGCYCMSRYFSTAVLKAFGSCHIAKWLRLGIIMSVEPGSFLLIGTTLSFLWPMWSEIRKSLSKLQFFKPTSIQILRQMWFRFNHCFRSRL